MAHLTSKIGCAVADVTLVCLDGHRMTTTPEDAPRHATCGCGKRWELAEVSVLLEIDGKPHSVQSASCWLDSDDD